MIPEPTTSLAPGASRPTSWGRAGVLAVRALRPHQWVKNAIVAVPLLGAHRFGDPGAVRATALAAFAFSLTASAGYVVNDLSDVEADRGHPGKRKRPFASGELPRAAGPVLVSALLLAAGACAAALPLPFTLCLVAYLAATVGYTFAFRRRPVLDVLVLAGMYTARIFAGGLATGIPVSEWLTSFSMFLFLSLAFLKRAAELEEAPQAMETRGYSAPDREMVSILGASSGLMSVVVFTLYLASPDVVRLYAHPRRLWAVCPLLLYWVAHLWMRARRRAIRGDPVVVALTDRVTWIVAALGAAVVFVAL